jgi:hypothetical protein
VDQLCLEPRCADKGGSETGKDFSAIGVQIILAEVVIPMRVQG